MINFLKLLPEWSWDGFDQVLTEAGTTSVELVPSMVLGVDWDQFITEKDGPVQETLFELLQRSTVETIQSLTYGLPINLADPWCVHPELDRRIRALGLLGKEIGCSTFILGSPGQKKLKSASISIEKANDVFADNCRHIASLLSDIGTLSLEHNTIAQGAEFCNTLSDIMNLVKLLQSEGLSNVAVNLDTKCLIHEFGDDLVLQEVIQVLDLENLIGSIQVSFDFLQRDFSHARTDKKYLKDLAFKKKIPISLEEFGLNIDELSDYIAAWRLN